MTINKEAYEEAMDDVHTRFILNLPPEELETSDRIFFQLEQAWWFYDDFICDGAAAKAAAAGESGDNVEEELPRFKHLKPFSLAMFEFSPLLRPLLPKFPTMYAEFSSYKRSISTYSTILLNSSASKVALCRIYNGKSWTLPGGKVNQNERGRVAAARETYEETGFDPDNERGICAVWKERRERGEVVQELMNDNDDIDEDVADGAISTSPLLPWQPLQDEDKLVYTESDTKKRRTCYICRGVPESFPFQPVTRKEVSEVAWHDLNSLPKHTYAVLPFLGQLRRWIKRDNRRRFQEKFGGVGEMGEMESEWNEEEKADKRNNSTHSRPKSRSRQQTNEAALCETFSTPTRRKETQNDPSSKKDKRDGSSTKPKSRSNSNHRSNSRPKSNPRSKSNQQSNKRQGQAREVGEDDPLVASALASPGESNRWTEEDMFATNERLLGRKITYDGNPHDFAEKGFEMGKMLGDGSGSSGGGGRIDPHAFRVVGGGFMNSSSNMEGSGDLSGLASPPDAIAMQPLVARVRSGSKVSQATGASGGENYDEEDLALTPFFTEDGKAPWEDTLGDVEGSVLPLSPNFEKEIAATPSTPSALPVRPAPLTHSNSKGLALLNRLRHGAPANGNEEEDSNVTLKEDTSDTSYDWFLTDKEITAKCQQEKLGSLLPQLSQTSSTVGPSSHLFPSLQQHQKQQQNGNDNISITEDTHWKWMKQWVQTLSETRPTKEFGDFHFDVDAIMNSMAIRT